MKEDNSKDQLSFLETIISKEDKKEPMKVNLSKEYLLNLKEYNPHLTKCGSIFTNAPRNHNKIKDDNLLLRLMYNGLQNTNYFPKSLINNLNGLEIAMIASGIFFRKHVYEEFVVKTNNIYQPTKKINAPLENRKNSRLKTEGVLLKDAYSIIDHLMNSYHLRSIRKNYQSEWETRKSEENPKIDITRFNKLNPYDPSTLKERIQNFEKEYPVDFKKFKEALSAPYLPEQKIKHVGNGNYKVVANHYGFEIPGLTYRRGVKGKAFYRLDEYADKVMDRLK